MSHMNEPRGTESCSEISGDGWAVVQPDLGFGSAAKRQVTLLAAAQPSRHTATTSENSLLLSGNAQSTLCDLFSIVAAVCFQL